MRGTSLGGSARRSFTGLLIALSPHQIGATLATSDLEDFALLRRYLRFELEVIPGGSSSRAPLRQGIAAGSLPRAEVFEPDVALAGGGLALVLDPLPEGDRGVDPELGRVEAVGVAREAGGAGDVEKPLASGACAGPSTATA